MAVAIGVAKERSDSAITYLGWMFISLVIGVAILTKIPAIGDLYLVRRYLLHGEFAFFLICGYGLGLFPHGVPENEGVGWRRIAIGFCAIVLVAPYHQFGAVCLSLGVVGGFAIGLTRTIPFYLVEAPSPRKLLFTSSFSVFAFMLPLFAWFLLLLNPPIPRPHLERGEFEAAVREQLAEVDPGAMIAAGPEAFMFQAQTGHPVFVDATTKSLMSYMPELGPVINKMYTEVYGMPIEPGPYDPDRWLEVWEGRSRDDWAALEPWGFDYVAAPDSIELDLDEVLEAGGQRLYRMP